MRHFGDYAHTFLEIFSLHSASRESIYQEACLLFLPILLDKESFQNFLDDGIRYKRAFAHALYDVAVFCSRFSCFGPKYITH